MIQKDLILKLLERNKDAIIIGSLGSISKDLDEIQHKNKILVKGAMGCVIGIGLGLALNTKKKVLVIIGDGAFLMKLGSLAALKRYKPKNLNIVVIQNDCYASCGGQKINFKYLF